nr:MAG TPA: hypothetical protein [Caudoviricetes sp.]
MDAVEFFKTVKRLCKNQGCDGCPVCKNNTCMVMLMSRIYGASDESIEETISKVEQWAKDHPVKTRQSEFLKMFPDAQTDGGVINFCPNGFLPKGEAKAYCKKYDKCIECRKDYWLAEVTEND